METLEMAKSLDLSGQTDTAVADHLWVGTSSVVESVEMEMLEMVVSHDLQRSRFLQRFLQSFQYQYIFNICTFELVEVVNTK